jgi:hypothetical protein
MRIIDRVAGFAWIPLVLLAVAGCATREPLRFAMVTGLNPERVYVLRR